jgi:FdhE protein
MNADTQARLIDRKLAAIRAADVVPAELVDLAERVLSLQIGARDRAHIELPDPSACADTAQLFAGSPLILRRDFPRDAAQARELAPALLDALAGAGGPAAKASEALRAALDSGELDLDAVFLAHATGEDEPFAAWRERLPESPRALDFLATSALWPSLNRAAELLAPRLPAELPYEGGHCPLCGSLTYITFLSGKEGRRTGACSFCGFEYRVKRIGCTTCGEADAGKLRQFRVEELPHGRVDVCDACGTYVKTLDFRELDDQPVPALDDMASVALDVLAQSQGLRRATLSAWGF